MLLQFLNVYYNNTFRNMDELFEKTEDMKLLDSCHNDLEVGIKLILNSLC